MNKKSIITVLLVLLWVTMACTISYEGINFGSDPDIEFIEDQTATAGSAQLLGANPAEATPAPEYQPAAPQSSGMESAYAGAQEYSVTATNFDCTCQVDGNVTTNFNFKGDQLEVINAGGASDVYDKVGENTYKRSFMGYYILNSGSGAQATSTVVEEEKHVVIIFTDSGYVMEHYSGSADSPCCYHTFTSTK